VKFCKLLKNKNIYETTDQTHTHTRARAHTHTHTHTLSFYNKKKDIFN